MTGCLGSVLAALVDGELDHAAREKAQRHLAHCDVCRAEVEAQRRLKASLSRLDPELPSTAFLARLTGISSMPPVEPLPAAGRATWRPQATSALGPRTVRAGATGPRVPDAVPASWTAPPPVLTRSAQPAPPDQPARSARPSVSAVALAVLPGSRTPPVPTTSTRPASHRPALRVTSQRRGSAPRHRAAVAGSAFAVLGVAAALALAAPPQRPASTPVGPLPGAFVSDVTGSGGARSGGTLGSGLTSVSTSVSTGRSDGGAAVARPAVPVRAVVSTAGRRSTR